jgi:rhodanese-related sulfurtransferase
MNNSKFYLLSGIFSLGYTIYAGLKYYSISGNGFVTTDEAKKMIRNKEINYVIDVRTNEEYKQGHYNRALNIPVTEMTNANLKNISKDSSILVYCKTGKRSRIASEKMREKGYKNVYYITGSYKELS